MTTNRNTLEATSGDPASHQSAKPLPAGVLNLEELRNRCLGNIDLVHRLLKMFEERIPMEMETMQKALDSRNIEEVAHIAHRVKGSSASLSADGLRRAAAEIEDVSREGRVADIPPGLEHLHDEWEKYLNCAAALLSAADTT